MTIDVPYGCLRLKFDGVWMRDDRVMKHNARFVFCWITVYIGFTIDSDQQGQDRRTAQPGRSNHLWMRWDCSQTLSCRCHCRRSLPAAWCRSEPVTRWDTRTCPHPVQPPSSWSLTTASDWSEFHPQSIRQSLEGCSSCSSYFTPKRFKVQNVVYWSMRNILQLLNYIIKCIASIFIYNFIIYAD